MSSKLQLGMKGLHIIHNNTIIKSKKIKVLIKNEENLKKSASSPPMVKSSFDYHC